MAEQKYPSEVKDSVLLKAMSCIAIARKEKRLAWVDVGKVLEYKTRDGERYTKTIDEMPAFFLLITGTFMWVAKLFEDGIDQEIKDTFIKVLDTPIGKLNPEKFAKEAEEKLNQLRELEKKNEHI